MIENETFNLFTKKFMAGHNPNLGETLPLPDDQDSKVGITTAPMAAVSAPDSFMPSVQAEPTMKKIDEYREKAKWGVAAQAASSDIRQPAPSETAPDATPAAAPALAVSAQRISRRTILLLAAVFALVGGGAAVAISKSAPHGSGEGSASADDVKGAVTVQIDPAVLNNHFNPETDIPAPTSSIIPETPAAPTASASAQSQNKWKPAPKPKSTRADGLYENPF